MDLARLDGLFDLFPCGGRFSEKPAPHRRVVRRRRLRERIPNPKGQQKQYNTASNAPLISHQSSLDPGAMLTIGNVFIRMAFSFA
ncbi:MAG: hypothetical protein ACTHLZ_06230 [Tepidisphaeraceae bacterium]